ncbi:MAG: hypothetical protein WBZ48_08130, partial [Bacteroidota bacterium]
SEGLRVWGLHRTLQWQIPPPSFMTGWRRRDAVRYGARREKGVTFLAFLVTSKKWFSRTKHQIV